jgi:indolepyruvate decarboxylase
MILDGPFNDIANWDYANLPRIFGNGSASASGIVVKTEDELADALTRVDKGKLAFIEVQTDKWDSVDTLKKATQSMQKRVISTREMPA